ncbi:hypothetical protein OAL09_11625 [Verrucomicrobia bacterium]|nr:hypothetical protein [Verrucomicrobiota bacterium]
MGWGAGTSTITVTGPGSELRNSGRFVVGNNASHGALAIIESQLCLARRGIRAVAIVTGIR